MFLSVWVNTERLKFSMYDISSLIKFVMKFVLMLSASASLMKLRFVISEYLDWIVCKLNSNKLYFSIFKSNSLLLIWNDL